MPLPLLKTGQPKRGACLLEFNYVRQRRSSININYMNVIIFDRDSLLSAECLNNHRECLGKRVLKFSGFAAIHRSSAHQSPNDEVEI
jgi:hypothetical protein